ncbi:MAG: sensor histidine kinase [Ignavibacteriaceae bacterium]
MEVEKISKKTGWNLIIIFALLTCIIIAGGMLYYSTVKNEGKKEAYRNLVEASRIKTEQIRSWLAERNDDAKILESNFQFKELVKKQIQKPSPKIRRQIDLFLKSINANYDYSGFSILNPKGKKVLTLSDNFFRVNKNDIDSAIAALKTGNISFSDLQKHNSTNEIYLDIRVPLLLSINKKENRLGVLLMRINPGKNFYHIIQFSSGSYKTIEYLIVRKDRNYVLYLNNLDYMKNAALNLKLSLSDTNVISVKAILGRRGIVEGKDYRGKEVLAVISHIPITNWFLIAKIDSEEIYSDIRQRTVLITIIAGFLILLAAFYLFLIWKYMQSIYIKNLYKAEEDEIKRLNEELEHRVVERTSQLLASNKELEAFSYSVSHDLRAPLRAIGGFSRIVLEEYANKLDDNGKRLLNVIRDNSQKMGHLIDDLLSFSRTGRKDVVPSIIDMNSLFTSIYNELKMQSPGRNIQFDIDQLPESVGDLSLLKQVAINLLSNAIKFSRKRHNTVIEVGFLPGKNENIYYVRDNGVGFDMKYKDKLFGVFQRLHTEDEFEGTGVGLAIVQRIIHKHNGRVWAESTLNEGATFYFSLPKKI